jgi:hypothetical protein
VSDAKTRHMIAYSAAAAGLTGMVISALINPSFTGVAFGAATGAGALYGLLLSVVQVSVHACNTHSALPEVKRSC